MLFVRKNRNAAQAEPRYIQIDAINRQRLLGYAESFRRLSDSLGGEFQVSEKDRTRLLEERKQWENRQVISSNLQEMAEIMTHVATEEIRYEPMEEKKSRMLIQALRAEKITAQTICYLPGEENRRIIGMMLSTTRKSGVATEDVADMLSVLLKCRLQVSATSPYLVDEVPRSFVFTREPHYLVLTGVCKAVKENEVKSGDNYSVLETDNGNKILLLSDGTGSGVGACRDSEKVIDLTEKMLEAGFGTEVAVNLVNAAVFAGGEERNHPTLDICNLDLYTGTCQLCKSGGAVTFLKRDTEVEQLHSGSLPLGVFQKPDVKILTRQLQDGDYLILMTDGVLDALGPNECEALMSDMLSQMKERNPQDMAEKILQGALHYSGGRIRDDMTVLVVGVWNNG